MVVCWVLFCVCVYFSFICCETIFEEPTLTIIHAYKYYKRQHRTPKATFISLSLYVFLFLYFGSIMLLSLDRVKSKKSRRWGIKKDFSFESIQSQMNHNVTIEPLFPSYSIHECICVDIMVIHYLITLSQRHFLFSLLVASIRWKIPEIMSKISTNHNLTENGGKIIMIIINATTNRFNSMQWQMLKRDQGPNRSNRSNVSLSFSFHTCVPPSVQIELVDSLAARAHAHAHAVQWIMWSMIIGNLFKKTLKQCRQPSNLTFGYSI